MGTDLSESRRERSEERRWGDSPLRNSEEYDEEKIKNRGEHRSKDRKRSRREDKDHISRDKDRSKSKDGLKDREKDVRDSGKDRISSKEKRKDRIEEHDKDRTKDKGREKDLDRDKQRGKVHDRDDKDRKRKRDSERDRENEPDRDQEKEKEKDKGKEKEKEKEKGREKDKGSDRVEVKDREKEKEKTRERDEERKRDKNKDSFEKEKDKDYIRERKREVDHGKDRSRRSRDDHDSRKDGTKDAKLKGDGDFNRERDAFLQGKISPEEDAALIKQGDEHPSGAQDQSRKDIEERILKVKEERLKRKSEGVSEIEAWVNRSRKLEEKITSEKQKAKQRSKMFDEQDNVDDDDDDDDDGVTRGKGDTDALAGVKVLHGVDKVLEGGSVVLTLKDQDILAGDDVNENMDILENVEIGEQKRRNEAYKAGKKTTGMYDDKFNDQLGDVKKMLPQYDDPAEEEGVTLDGAGRFTADKKIEELRRKLQIPSHINQVEDLNSSVRISSDYYTPQEMLQFKKPKKKKSLRKKEKLDIDALEAEARAEGLGASDLRSRNDSKTQIAKEEEDRVEAKRRSNAYQTAVARADEASKALRLEQTLPTLKEEDDADVFDADAEDLQKSLERARKLALKKQPEKALIGPEAIARLAKSIVSSESVDAQNSTSGDASDNRVVFTEMEEFVWGLQHDEDTQRPNHEDVFMEEDETPTVREEKVDVDGGWTAVSESEIGDSSMAEVEEEIIPDNTIHEVSVGKGLGGALKLFKERGALKEAIEFGGRNMDKKKSKLVGIHDDEGTKEIHLERRDEFGRVLPPKEAFRLLSHVFHGKGPGKRKQEKRIKQYHDEQKLKKMTSSDVLPLSVERMKEAQLQTQSAYVVLSGHVKPGQSSDHRSGFATVEKEVPGSLTPMLGDEKVEHFLGIKRKANTRNYRPPRKP